VHGKAEPDLLEELTRHIRAQLIIAGFEESDDASAIQLDVAVADFSPGNAALRYLVSFGAGRGSLLYRATYSTADGQVLAQMDGQERFTGTEVSFNQHYGGTTTLRGADTVRSVLIQEAAKHIVELGRKGPQPEKTQRRRTSQPGR
jgi:hypothetical protein